MDVGKTRASTPSERRSREKFAQGRAHVRRRPARPGRVGGAAERRLDRDAADAHDRARDAGRLRRDGHGHRGAHGDRARARGRDRRSSTATSRSRSRSAEVDKVKRSEAGMIVEPLTLPPDALVSDALALMEHYHISGVPITDDDGRLVGILTNRDLRFEQRRRAARLGADDARDLVTAPVGTTLARGRAAPPPPPDREAAGRRRRRRAHGPDHGQGHPEAHRVPARDEGPAGPAARRRRGRRRPGRARARAGAGRGRRRRARRRHGARPLARRDRDGRRASRACPATSRSSPATSRPARRPRR